MAPWLRAQFRRFGVSAFCVSAFPFLRAYCLQPSVYSLPKCHMMTLREKTVLAKRTHLTPLLEKYKHRRCDLPCGFGQLTAGGPPPGMCLASQRDVTKIAHRFIGGKRNGDTRPSPGGTTETEHAKAQPSLRDLDFLRIRCPALKRGANFRCASGTKNKAR